MAVYFQAPDPDGSAHPDQLCPLEWPVSQQAKIYNSCDHKTDIEG